MDSCTQTHWASLLWHRHQDSLFDIKFAPAVDFGKCCGKAARYTVASTTDINHSRITLDGKVAEETGGYLARLGLYSNEI